VRACLSFAFITIPSIEDVFVRLRLYLLSSEAALQCLSLPQADAFLKTAITVIPEIPTTINVDSQIINTEDTLVGFIQQFIALLVVVPGSPDLGPFYLLKGLQNVINDYNWERSDAKVRIYLAMLALISTQAQAKLPYHISKVDSNDVLYYGDDEYMEEAKSIASGLITDTLIQLAAVGEDKDVSAPKRLSKLALDFINTIVTYAEIDAQMITLVVKLYGLAKKTSDASTFKSTLQYIRSRGFTELYSKLAALQ